MAEFLPPATRRLVALVGPDPDETQRAMQAHADESAFPIIGPTVGGLLAVFSQLTGAQRVFELGSGFGYSASWFARGMPFDGEVVLTEVDEDELELARTFLEDADYTPTFRYELGDAVEIVAGEPGSFDLVLLDHEKHRYAEGFKRVREKVTSGGAVVADNIMAGPLSFEDVLAGLEGEPTPDEHTAGIVEYVAEVHDDPSFETVLLPIGNGLTVSVRRR